MMFRKRELERQAKKKAAEKKVAVPPVDSVQTNQAPPVDPNAGPEVPPQDPPKDEKGGVLKKLFGGNK